VELRTLFNRLAALDPAHRVDVKVDEHLEACVDEDQLEQALINLLKNAVEAQGEDTRPILLTAESRGDTLAIAVRDSGPGIANPDNLFVPFFTTKQGGSGVGLALSRQIAEGHGGTLNLENRRDTRGAVATLEIPGAARLRP
jgi:signal transduction histidine kinase